MTTIFPEKKECACCQNQVEVMVLGSTNQMGWSDLDLRPAEMARSTIHSYPEYCPHCQYIYYDLSTEATGLAQFVREDPGYRRIVEGHNGEPRLSVKFKALVKTADFIGNRDVRIHARIHLAWSLDDEKDEEAAALARLDLVECIDQLGFQYQAEDTESARWTTELVVLDLLRRAGAFEKASTRQQILGDGPTELRMAEMWSFQQELIAKRDQSCYTIGDALGLEAGGNFLDQLDATGVYLWRHHRAALEAAELRALQAVQIGRRQKVWDTEEAQVLELLAAGKEGLAQMIEARLLREHGISINRCPACQAPARTPTARQCAECKHSWRES